MHSYENNKHEPRKRIIINDWLKIKLIELDTMVWLVCVTFNYVTISINRLLLFYFEKKVDYQISFDLEGKRLLKYYNS